VLGRAAREPRVIAGVLLLLVAVLLGYAGYRHVRSKADRDYAHCAPTPPPSDCQTRRKPLAIVTTRSSSDAFRKHYSLSVQTGDATTLSLAVSGAVAAHFGGRSTADVRYRHGHPAAIVAADGATVEVPFILDTRLAVAGGLGAALLMLGGGLLAWGLTRVNRRPRTA